MTTTINISLPKQLYEDVKKLVAEGKYHTISEAVRSGLRRVIYDANKITENGFPGWFEDAVLESAAEPVKKDIDKYFQKLHKRIGDTKQKKYAKGRENWQIQAAAR